jgi:uncharacterized protein YggE
MKMIKNKKLYSLAVALAVCLAVVGTTGATTVNGGGNATIAVSGTGIIEAEPNQAKVYLGVETQSESATDALAENSANMTAIIAALNRIGFSNDTIETSYFSINPIRDYETPDNEIVGYRVNNEVIVRITDLNRTGEVIAEATNAGANTVQSIEFGLTKEKEKEARDDAIQEACDDAESKAQAIASGLGLDIVRVLSVRESGVYVEPYRKAGYNFDSLLPTPVPALAPPIEPKVVEVRATIEVVYECTEGA